MTELSLAFSYIGSVTARHSSSGRQPNGMVQEIELFFLFYGRPHVIGQAIYICILWFLLSFFLFFLA